MADERVQRKLAAILAADVVGYSRLMEADEEGTLDRLKLLRRELFAPTTTEFGGRIFKLTGDGALAEFGSAANAVSSAVAIQQALADRNAEVPYGQRIELRIGISLGDVIVEGNDLYGNGVNIAARMEGLADPGGICISGNVHEHVRNMSGVAFTDLGDQQVKNIDQPVHAYQILLDRYDAPALDDRASPAMPDKPSIAVLPFTNMSGDPEQEYFADGITEDIITALSRITRFLVIARNSSFQYKGSSPDVRKVGAELGVRYVLEGSVRRSGNRLRINGQLIEAASGAHLWADRYEGDLEDVFDLQDQITEAVIGAIEPTITFAEIDRARRQPPDSLAAYDLNLQALPRLLAMRPEENKKGLDLLHQAIDLDPSYAVALANCAWGYEQRIVRGWGPYGEDDVATAIDLAHRILATKTIDAHALALAGFVLVMIGRDYDRGLSAIRRAEELNPNLAVVSVTIATSLIFAGEDIDLAFDHVQHGLRVSPGDPLSYVFWTTAGFCHLFRGRFEKAVEMCQRSLDIYADWDTTYMVLVPSLVRLGRMDEAKKALGVLRKLSPHITGALLRKILPFRNSAMLEEIVTGLISAGLPE